MILPELVFINSKELPGGELILSTVAPYNIARVYKFNDAKALENFAIKYNVVLDAAHVIGYYILICFVGNIEKVSEAPILGHNINAKAKEFLKTATIFYEKERIKGNETRLKRYLRN
jgi:hypothetical protein